MTNETLVDQLSESRTCANCACHHVRANPLTQETQSFCRRNTAMTAMGRVRKPRLINGQLVIDKITKKPQEVEVQEMFFLHQPTLPDLTCFDGWRPLGTEPGDFTYKTMDLEKMYLEGMAKLSKDMREQFIDDILIDEEEKKN
jgi:hypothetical protein